MKYVVLLCDGMADLPVPELNGKTPMQVAYKPAMDALAMCSEVGLACNVPDGMPAGSDVANLSVIGYNPRDCYTGRSPLEAASIGVELADDDVALRCNLVTLSDADAYGNRTMLDYCGGDISTEEAAQIIASMQEYFGGGSFDFHVGTAYRHCLVWHHCTENLGTLTPPHDISGRVIGEHLPLTPASLPLLRMMEESVALLENHPVNISRRERGLPPANALWFWGQGSKPQLPLFLEKFGLKGAMVSAVDLLKGIATLAGMRVCYVEGATGYIDTNFKGKLQAALDSLRDGYDYAYIHLEAPDESGHRGEVQHKVQSIESIDREILVPLLAEMSKTDDFVLLICPDHPTPLTLKTHTRTPVPYLLYRSNAQIDSGLTAFTEESAASTGNFFPEGFALLPHMMNP